MRQNNDVCSGVGKLSYKRCFRMECGAHVAVANSAQIAAVCALSSGARGRVNTAASAARKPRKFRFCGLVSRSNQARNTA